MEVRVLFNYNAREADELTLKKGDVVKCVEVLTDGWYEGSLNGKTGVFPGNYTQVLEESSNSTGNVGKPGNIAKGPVAIVKPMNSQVSRGTTHRADNDILNEVRRIQLKKKEAAGRTSAATIQPSYRTSQMSAAPSLSNARQPTPGRGINTRNDFRPRPPLPLNRPVLSPRGMTLRSPAFNPTPQNEGSLIDNTSANASVTNRLANIMTDHPRQTRPGLPTNVRPTMPGPPAVRIANNLSNVAFNTNKSNPLNTNVGVNRAQPSSSSGERFQNNPVTILSSSRPSGIPPPPPAAPILPPTTATSNMPVGDENRNHLMDSIKTFKKDGLKKVSTQEGKGQTNHLVASLKNSKMFKHHTPITRGDSRDDSEWS